MNNVQLTIKNTKYEKNLFDYGGDCSDNDDVMQS